MNVLYSYDGLNAISLLKKLTYLPSFILLDLNMPRMGGREVLKYLKADEKLKKIPVVMYSNSIDTKTERLLKSVGAFDFIQKSYAFNSLILNLKTIIDKLLQEY